jgi:hypothetical protein
MHSLCGFPVRRIGLELELGVNAPNDQDAVFDFDFTHCIGRKTVVRSGDLTRLQRASEGAGESTGGGGYDVVQGSSARLNRTGRHFIMFGDGAVHSENDRLGFRGEISPPDRPLHTLDSNLRPVHDVGH